MEMFLLVLVVLVVLLVLVLLVLVVLVVLLVLVLLVLVLLVLVLLVVLLVLVLVLLVLVVLVVLSKMITRSITSSVIKAIRSLGTLSKKPQVHPDLLKIIACPLTKNRLEYNEQEGSLYSSSIQVKYYVSELGFPNLIPHDADLLNPTFIDSPKQAPE
eukprot:gene7807-9955_t